MRPAGRLLCSSLLMLIFAAGCGAETPSLDARALRAGFPQQEAEVLNFGGGFVATDRGFSAGHSTEFGGDRAIAAELPRLGSGAIRLTLKDGFEVRVKELSAEGEGAMIEKAIAYRRAGGTAYWTAAPDKVEEWLHVTARRGEITAAWEVEGASIEQRGENVALVDASGVARLWVSAPTAFASGGRPIQPVLRAANGRIELSVMDAEGEVLVDPAWTTDPKMNLNQARAGHEAAPITKGRVLVAGGWNGMNYLASAEAYDSGLNSWKPLSQMAKDRGHHTMTVLDNGDVLVTGGVSGQGQFENTVEIFSVDTETWTNKAPMNTGRSRHTATRLGNGMVLIVGGEGSSGVLATSQIFDPYTNGYSSAPSLSDARRNHTATLLGDGTVLVVGGHGAAGELSSAEIYHPVSKEWKKPPNALSKPRYRHTATLLFDGRVLVTGGTHKNAALATCEIYEPGTKKWSSVAEMSIPRVDHTAVALSNGRVLVVGGSLGGVATKSTETYDPETNTWFKSGELSTEREEHTATRLGDGRVVIAGGMNPKVLSSAELFRALQLGEACEEGSECLSGFCSDNVCCNRACPASPCGACSTMAGSDHNGLCKILDESQCDQCQLENLAVGESCDDKDQCTLNDTCDMDGKCTGDPVTCEAFDICHVAGTCNPKNGICSNPEAPTCDPTEDIKKPEAPKDITYCEVGSETAGCPDDTFCVEGVCCDKECTDSTSECFTDGIHGAMEVTCSEKGATCSRADRIPFSCSPFRCIVAFGACSTSCSKIEDCAVPYVCSPESECVPAPPISSGYASSCSLAAAAAAPAPASKPESSRAAWIAMLVAGLLAARRKQKLSANPQA